MATPVVPSNTARVQLIDEFGVVYKATGGGSSVEIQVEGVDNASQTLVNFVSGTPANCTISNPSGGIVQFDITAAGTGDVVGPASAVNADIAVFNGITGKLIADGGTTIAAINSSIAGKQPTGNYITALTGDVTASGPGSVAATLANIPNATPMAGDLLATAIVAPATPGAGKGAVYVDSTSKNLAVKDDAGVVKHGVQTQTSASNTFLTAISDAGAVSTGTAVTSINKTGSTALVGAVTLTGGSNVTLTQSGQDISIASTGGGGTTVFQQPGLRLTLTTGVPVTTSDVTAAGTLFWTPYTSGNVWYWDGAAWQVETITEQSLALTLTSGKNYDVFYLHGTGLVLSNAWTNDTTRADALGTQNGVTVLSSDHTKLWIGTIRASGTNTTEDSLLKRYVNNDYNYLQRRLFATSSTTHTYASSTIRQWNADTANQVDFVVGRAGVNTLNLHFMNIAAPAGGGSTSRPKAGLSDLDSTTAYYTNGVVVGDSSAFAFQVAHGQMYVPGIGRHFVAALEDNDDNALNASYFVYFIDGYILG